MSVSIIAIPIVLAFDIEKIAAAAELSNAIKDSIYKEAHHIRINEIIEKEFETAYMDKDLLLKTLEEHGLDDIEEDYDGKISGSIENFTLSFSRESNDKPYSVKISCRDCDNAEEKLNDLNAEYALNAQEDAYLNLVENLKEKNLEIEEEVVEDDNTIVLTINLE